MTTRRLAAILAADVAGFSALMERDEEGTFARVKALRHEVIEPALARHEGRLVKTTGDGFLAEFVSPVEAVRCALAVQDEVAGREAEHTGEPLRLRIGVNLGDVIVEDDGDLYGEGVNVTVRLEQMADSGGVLVSGKIHDEVAGKIGAVLEDRGEHQVKNIARPLRVYGTSGVRPAAKPLPLPEKPAIAVLPFANMSGEPEQAYFADGLTEDIITALSYWRWFPVIARNSTFAYKGKPATVTTIGRELGAAYVVEGSVRRAGERIRIGVQLVEASTGHQLWAERYDREILDIFALQDEITERVVASLEPELQRAEQNRVLRKPPESLDAWDLALRALALQHRVSRQSHAEARGFLEQALAIDPASSFAWSRLALCCYHEAILGWSEDRYASLQASLDAAERAIELEDRDWLGHGLRGMGCLWTRRDFDAALSAEERAVSLNPSAPLARHFLACVLEFSGRPGEAIPHLQVIHRLDPRYQFASLAVADEALCCLLQGEAESALKLAETAVRMLPANVRARQRLCAALALLGREAEAQAAMAELLRLQPSLSRAYVDETYPFRNAGDRELFAGALSRAGLPE